MNLQQASVKFRPRTACPDPEDYSHPDSDVREEINTMKSVAEAHAALDTKILETLREHKIDRWEIDTVKGASWIICACGQVDMDEDDHRVHQSTKVADAIEENKNLVFDLPSPEDNATTSRDFGRGFAHAVSLMQEALTERRFHP